MTSIEASSSEDKAATLRALHVPGDPLVLPNVWDAASARIVEAAGCVFDVDARDAKEFGPDKSVIAPDDDAR